VLVQPESPSTGETVIHAMSVNPQVGNWDFNRNLRGLLDASEQHRSTKITYRSNSSSELHRKRYWPWLMKSISWLVQSMKRHIKAMIFVLWQKGVRTGAACAMLVGSFQP